MCTWPTCKSPEYKNGLCFQHHRVYGNSQPIIRDSEIPKKSPKRIIDEKEYKKLVKQMLSENPSCELKIKGVCSGKAKGLHHMQKRTPKNYLDRNNLKRSCNKCNQWVELHPLEALSLGLSKSKHKIS